VTAQLVSGVVIGVVVAVASAFVSHLLILRRERERWEREDQRQREAWDRDTQLKHRDDRVALYRNFLADVRIATSSLTASQKEGLEALQRIMHGHAEIELLSSKRVDSVAWALVDIAFRISDLETKMQDAIEEGDHEAAKRHRAAVTTNAPVYRKRREVFVRAAREELGVDVTRPGSADALTGAPTEATEQPGRVESQPQVEEPQEGAEREPWSRRWFGG
jgi:hypothetical protein